MYQNSAQSRTENLQRQEDCALSKENDATIIKLAKEYKRLSSKSRCKIIKELEKVIITQGDKA